MRLSVFDRSSLLLATMFCSATLSRAALIKCTVVGDDFVPHGVQVAVIDADKVQGIDDVTKTTFAVPIDRLVRLESFTARARNTTPAPSGFAILLRDGQRWTGTPGAMAGDDLEWNNAGPVFDAKSDGGKVSLKHVIAIASFASTSPEQLERLAKSPAAAQDELVLANGDVMNGVVTASDEKTVTITPADGQPVSVDWANVRLLRLASSGAAPAAEAPAPYRLFLRDGRVIDGTSLTASDIQSVFITKAGGQMKLDAGENVLAIEHRSDRVKMLADLTPTSREYAPYFPSNAPAEAAAPPFVWASRPMRSSILARPHSVITWPLDGSMKTFVCRYAIPEGRSLADVTVRVKLDGNVVHEKQHVRAGTPGDLLKLPLGSAKSITLETDFGDRYDVQDDLYWLEPALLKD